MSERAFTMWEEIWMSDTKEKILFTALRLFARDGYEAVSVSAIAGELGMTKGALYKHYKNKRDSGLLETLWRFLFCCVRRSNI